MIHFDKNKKGIDVKSDQCCPTCKQATQCLDSSGMAYKNGEVWTERNEPCTHCTCIENEIKCTVEQCQATICKNVTSFSYFIPIKI